MDLTTLIYELTAEYPRQEVYGLTSQLRRSAVSIASNIAEGSARGTFKDFKQFVKIARGSNSELQTQLMISQRLGFGDKQLCEKALALSHRINKMLSGLSTYLSDKIRAKASTNNP